MLTFFLFVSNAYNIKWEITIRALWIFASGFTMFPRDEANSFGSIITCHYLLYLYSCTITTNYQGIGQPENIAYIFTKSCAIKMVASGVNKTSYSSNKDWSIHNNWDLCWNLKTVIVRGKNWTVLGFFVSKFRIIYEQCQ